MITSSLNKISYITLVTQLQADVIENIKGMYVFSIEDTEEVKMANEIYNNAVSLNGRLDVDMVRYNKIIHLYKDKVKVYKMLKERKEHLNNIDEICDKIINDLQK